MKILFVENRYKTIYWDAIATHLKNSGNEIFWIVQNHRFIPKEGDVFKIPYLKKGMRIDKKVSHGMIKIIGADRGLRYFGISSDDYLFYYRKQIEDILDKVVPDIVFGESTLFHELLTIDCCKLLGIPYLHPTTCRYPTGRFSFYKYDTLEPFGKSTDNWDINQIEYFINTLIQRTITPDYMLKPISLSKLELLKDKLRLIAGYYLGERYNTPNPIKKRILDKTRENFIKEWEVLAQDMDVFQSIKEKYKILYPLQMQPEANIDVWGYPNNNQTQVIEELINMLEDEEVLIIKPNPKSKYEIDSSLMSVFQKHKNKVVLLKHATSMNDVFNKIDFIVTVTGTVSLESFFGDKPFAFLGDSTLKYCFPNIINSVYDNRSVRGLINLSKKQNICHSLDDKVKFISYNIKHSFKGINGDGLHNKHYMMDKENMSNVLSGFFKVLNEINER